MGRKRGRPPQRIKMLPSVGKPSPKLAHLVVPLLGEIHARLNAEGDARHGAHALDRDMGKDM